MKDQTNKIRKTVNKRTVFKKLNFKFIIILTGRTKDLQLR